MKNQSVPPGAIVVGVDGSPDGDAARAWAVGEAVRARRPLHLVHSLEWLDAAPVSLGEDLDVTAQLQLDQVCDAGHDLAVTAHTSTGSAASALVGASRGAELVVLGGGGHGEVASLFLGSTAYQVCNHARCPVVIVPMQHNGPPDHQPDGIVVGLDASDRSLPALEFAFHQASSRKCDLTVVHSWWWQEPGGYMAGTDWEDTWGAVEHHEHEVVAKQVATWAEKYPDVTVSQHLIRGHPIMSLVQEAREAALLVLGSRGRGGFTGLLLGSVSHGVLARSTCPVAVVRATPPEPG